MSLLARRGAVSPRAVALAILVMLALLLPAAYVVAQSSATEQVTGYVLDVRTRPPLGVDSFDLLAGDGRHLTFAVGDLDVSNGFGAGHLVTHQATLQPVIVSYRHDGDRLVAVHLADAPAVSAQPSASSPSPGGS